MHNYHLDRGAPRCAFKVDIQKAYDTVDWEFLRVALIGFGFHDRMISWIMECVTTTSFSISINGSLHGYFKGKRGLRQGDPFSPYLFTLIMEVFTLMLHRRVREASSFTYHRYCSDLELINLCFADDLFLFAYGDVHLAKVIKEALVEFKDASGLNPIVMSADSAVTYTSVHSEARSWSIPSEDPYEEAARQLLEQAPRSPEYIHDPMELEDHVPVYIPEPEHLEDLVPAEVEAPTPLLPPSFLSPRIRPLSPRALAAEMRDVASSLYHSLHPSGTPPVLPIPLPVPSTSRRVNILEADMPPRKRLLLTTPRPGCEEEDDRLIDGQRRVSIPAEIEVLGRRESMLRAESMETFRPWLVEAHCTAFELEHTLTTLRTLVAVSSGLVMIVDTYAKMAPKRATRSTPVTTTPAPTATTTTTVTNAQLQAMIDQGVSAALAARNATRKLH
ncbi:putative reverse transcriptase domain, reverse transcriptase zinc-binding domain protein [Tanacetum coccineum]